LTIFDDEQKLAATFSFDPCRLKVAYLPKEKLVWGDSSGIKTIYSQVFNFISGSPPSSHQIRKYSRAKVRY
jgi:hypothetical protein